MKCLGGRPTHRDATAHHMHRIETRIAINASTERIWSLLIDFSAYGRWNPFLRSIEGTPAVGQSLRVRIRWSGMPAVQFRPTVLAVLPRRELRWRGWLPVPGLFAGEHYFVLEPAPDGGVILLQGELFSGLLVPLFALVLARATQEGFGAMNMALKREAERTEG